MVLKVGLVAVRRYNASLTVTSSVLYLVFYNLFYET